MKNIRCILLAGLLILLAVGIAIPLQIVRGGSPDYTIWNDLGIVYTPPSGSQAYYPSVLYDAGGFGGGSPLFKMWYSDGSGGVFVVTSTDGITWGSPVLANSGLSGSPNHVQVLYDPNCFGASSCGTTAAKYRIWYWDMNAKSVFHQRPCNGQFPGWGELDRQWAGRAVRQLSACDHDRLEPRHVRPYPPQLSSLRHQHGYGFVELQLRDVL